MFVRAALVAPLVFSLFAFLPTASAQAACVDVSTNNRHAGVAKDISIPVTGVTAEINPTNNAVPCSNGPGNDGVSFWVAIEPGAGSDDNGNIAAIVQIGVIKCNSLVPTYGCDPDQFHYFYADGGCSANLAVPEDLGPADASPHTYRIVRQSTGIWYFQIDGVTKRTLDEDNKSVNCWLKSEDKQATWFAESWDGGDQYSAPGAGTSGRVQFHDLRYRGSTTGSWVSPGLSDPCVPGAENSTIWDHKCNVWNDYNDRFEVWSAYR